MKKTEEFFNLFLYQKNSEQMLILELDLKKGCHLKATANNGAKTTLLVLLFTCIWYENCSFFL